MNYTKERIGQFIVKIKFKDSWYNKGDTYFQLSEGLEITKENYKEILKEIIGLNIAIDTKILANILLIC